MTDASAERVAIVGARFASEETREKVRAYVRTLPRGTTVVSGDADGVDKTAAGEAHAVGLNVEVFSPAHERMAVEMIGIWGDGDVLNLSKLESPRDLLFARNTMVAIRCTRMVAFVQGSKGGSWDAVRQAKRFNRPCEVVK